MCSAKRVEQRVCSWRHEDASYVLHSSSGLGSLWIRKYVKVQLCWICSCVISMFQEESWLFMTGGVLSLHCKYSSSLWSMCSQITRYGTFLVNGMLRCVSRLSEQKNVWPDVMTLPWTILLFPSETYSHKEIWMWCVSLWYIRISLCVTGGVTIYCCWWFWL